MKCGFVTPLVIEEMNPSEMDAAGCDTETAWFRLFKLLAYYSLAGLYIEVPKNFITDFASVPRLFWAFFSPDDPHYARAAVLHDWLYNQHLFPKAQCDLLFREAMLSLGVNKLTVWVLYHCVKWFGQHAYDNEKRQNLRAEKPGTQNLEPGTLKKGEE